MKKGSETAHCGPQKNFSLLCLKEAFFTYSWSFFACRRASVLTVHQGVYLTDFPIASKKKTSIVSKRAPAASNKTPIVSKKLQTQLHVEKLYCKREASNCKQKSRILFLCPQECLSMLLAPVPLLVGAPGKPLLCVSMSEACGCDLGASC